MPQGPTRVAVTNSAAIGNAWFVNETTGLDTNVGSAASPFATLTAAQAAAVANNNDVVYLVGSVHVTATVVWAKAGVSLVGLAAPSNNTRARISATGATPFSPLVNVTAQNCSFVNLGTFHGGFTGATGSQVCWAEAGGRNFYSNVQFFGGGDATTAALAGMRSLTIGGQGENLFVGCTIGLDTIVRATNANASLEIIAGSTRNTIRSSEFPAYCTAAGDTFVTIASGGMDRYLILDGCVFQNFGGTSLTAAITNAGGSPAGNVLVTPTCIFVGATAIATTGAVYVSGAVPTATTSNIGILAT